MLVLIHRPRHILLIFVIYVSLLIHLINPRLMNAYGYNERRVRARHVHFFCLQEI